MSKTRIAKVERRRLRRYRGPESAEFRALLAWVARRQWMTVKVQAAAPAVRELLGVIGRRPWEGGAQ